MDWVLIPYLELYHYSYSYLIAVPSRMKIRPRNVSAEAFQDGSPASAAGRKFIHPYRPLASELPARAARVASRNCPPPFLPSSHRQLRDVSHTSTFDPARVPPPRDYRTGPRQMGRKSADGVLVLYLAATVKRLAAIWLSKRRHFCGLTPSGWQDLARIGFGEPGAGKKCTAAGFCG